jgi:hypothetical protein
MKKTIITAFAAALCMTALHYSSNAQGRFSIGAELALPMGNFSDAAGIGFGASAGYELSVSDNIGVTGNAGYLMFGKKTFNTGFAETEFKYSMIPIQIGGKYYFGETMEGIYLGAQVGVHMLSLKVETPSVTIGGVTIPGSSSSDSETKISYAPQVGYHLANIDIGVRYQMVATEGSTTSYLGARIAYVFGGK